MRYFACILMLALIALIGSAEMSLEDFHKFSHTHDNYVHHTHDYSELVDIL